MGSLFKPYPTAPLPLIKGEKNSAADRLVKDLNRALAGILRNEHVVKSATAKIQQYQREIVSIRTAAESMGLILETNEASGLVTVTPRVHPDADQIVSTDMQVAK